MLTVTFYRSVFGAAPNWPDEVVESELCALRYSLVDGRTRFQMHLKLNSSVSWVMASDSAGICRVSDFVLSDGVNNVKKKLDSIMLSGERRGNGFKLYKDGTARHWFFDVTDARNLFVLLLLLHPHPPPSTRTPHLSQSSFSFPVFSEMSVVLLFPYK